MLTTSNSSISSTPRKINYKPGKSSPLVLKAQKNDDDVEARQRRKSLLKEKRTSLVFSPRNKITLSPSTSNKNRRESNDFVPPVFPQSMKEASTRFEEFMKIAADNVLCQILFIEN